MYPLKVGRVNHEGGGMLESGLEHDTVTSADHGDSLHRFSAMLSDRAAQIALRLLCVCDSSRLFVESGLTSVPMRPDPFLF